MRAARVQCTLYIIHHDIIIITSFIRSTNNEPTLVQYDEVDSAWIHFVSEFIHETISFLSLTEIIKKSLENFDPMQKHSSYVTAYRHWTTFKSHTSSEIFGCVKYARWALSNWVWIIDNEISWRKLMKLCAPVVGACLCDALISWSPLNHWFSHSQQSMNFVQKKILLINAFRIVHRPQHV